MIETSIEKFKSVYPSISDLILSLDQKNKVILKPRKEIAIYIDNKPVYCQEDIINELIELSDIEAISEQYLSDDRIIHGQKVSFKSYLKIKLNTIKSRIKYAQLCEDNRIIQNLKKEIQALNTDSIKINFLLQKKRDLEGNYPESLGKILKKDNIYLFLKKELKFWEIHNEVLDKDISPKTKPLPQLPTNLTNEQRGLLFDLLVKYKFIPETTNKKNFIWTFGTPVENMPKHWQSTIWNKNKQLLRELLNPFKKSNLKIADIEKLVPLLFKDKKGNPFTLTKNKCIPSLDSDIIADIHKKIATI